MFTVDGMQWTFPCDIERVSEIKASEISGMLLDKSYFNDVIGTYLKYSITLVVPFGEEATYATLYEIITEPVDAHTFILPYNEGSITIVGRVDAISDVYRRMPDGTIHWKGIKFDVISNNPNKTHSLGEVVNRGVMPYPNVIQPETGTIYEYNGTQWVPADYDDADNIEY